jgi:glycosyltransferase involved in cell wall biosynthesis
MRIMMVAQWFPPVIGGEERHVLHLGEELVRRGHDVSVVTLLQTGLPVFEVVAGIHVHRIQGTFQRVGRLFRDDRRKSAAPMPDPELVAAFRRVLAEEQPDIVHAHNWLVHSILPMIRVRRVPLVVTLHDFSMLCARKDYMFLGATNCSGPAASKCLRCAARHYGAGKGIATVGGVWAMAPFERANVNRFIAVSQSIADGNRLKENGLPYSIIPNFIPDADSASELDVPAEIPGLPEERFLLYVGAISRIKGVPELIRAYAGLDEPPPLVLIGYPGAETAEILRALPAGVTYLQSLPHAAVLEAWRRSRVGLVPSICRDASPTVVLEAMAARTPLIASRIGGIPDMIEADISGLLVDPGDVPALRTAMARVIHDDELAERLAAAGSERVRAFTAAAVVPRIEQVYAEVIHGQRRRPAARNESNDAGEAD